MRLATSTIVLAIIFALWVTAADFPAVPPAAPAAPAPLQPTLTPEPEVTMGQIERLSTRAKASSARKQRAAALYREAAEEAVRRVEMEREPTPASADQ